VGHTAPGCIAVSLIKGVEFDDKGIVLISSILSKELKGMDVSVLMGANLAWEVPRTPYAVIPPEIWKGPKACMRFPRR